MTGAGDVGRSLEQVAVDLDALGPRDFDLWNEAAYGLQRLGDLCDEMAAINDVDRCAPVLFRTMERLDGLEIGSPGPLVHTLERWSDDYQRFLADSIRRRPSALALWMVNRILNTDPADAAVWFDLLSHAADRADVLPATRAEARKFLEYQHRRYGAGL